MVTCVWTHLRMFLNSTFVNFNSLVVKSMLIGVDSCLQLPLAQSNKVGKFSIFRLFFLFAFFHSFVLVSIQLLHMFAEADICVSIATAHNICYRISNLNYYVITIGLYPNHNFFSFFVLCFSGNNNLLCTGQFVCTFIKWHYGK
jgi:hypothetical protein